jgi:hypothetical protein
MFKEKISAFIILALSLLMFFAFGFYRIEKFITTDEHYWIQERIPQYWNAALDGKWKKTLINDKPGVSLAFVSGFGLLFEEQPELYIKPEKHLSVYNPAVTQRLILLFRTPLLLFNGLFSFFFFWIIYKITEKKFLSLWFSIFILLSPILLGISRIINPDSLLWVFSTATVFSFLAYLKSAEKKFIAWSAFFLGFSLLSKYIATILFPFLFILLLSHILRNFNNWNEKNSFKKNVWNFSIGYWSVVIGSIIIFSFLFPAVIFVKDYFQQKTVATIFGQLRLIFPLIFSANILLLAVTRYLKKETLFSFWKKLSSLKYFLAKLVYLILAFIFILILLNWSLGNDFLNLAHIPFDARKEPVFSVELSLYQKIILEFYPLVFSLSPLVIFSLLFLWIKSIFKKIAFEQIVFPLSLFLLIYIGASIFNNLLITIRYGIMLYPLLFFIAAVGIWEFVGAFPSLNSKKIFISFCILAISLLSLWWARPFYFEYTNSLLPKKYFITGSWGEGGYEAAQYLNSLPNAEHLTVWADYAGTCEFFVGRCLKDYKVNELKNTIDYYVLTRRGEIRLKPEHIRWLNPKNVDAAKYYKKTNPVWRLDINGRPDDFIKIFKAEVQ